MPSQLDNIIMAILNSLGTSGYPALQMCVLLLWNSKKEIISMLKNKMFFYTLGFACLEMVAEFL